MTETERKKLKEQLELSSDLHEKFIAASDLCDDSFSQNNYEDTRKYALEAIRLGKEINKSESIVSKYQIIGITYAMQDDQQKAIENFETSLQLANEIKDDYGIAQAHLNIGSNWFNINNYYNALENYIKALTAYKGITTSDPVLQKNITSDTVIVNNNIALIFLHLKRYNDAMLWLNKTISIDTTEHLEVTYHNLAACYYQQKDLRQSLLHLNKSLKYSQQNSNTFCTNLCFIAIADIYTLKKKYHQALELLLKAHTSLFQANIYSYCLDTINRIATIYILQKKHTLAKPYLKKGLKIINQVTSENFICEFYKTYSKFSFEIGKPNDAYKYLQKSYELNTKIFNDNLLQNTTFLAAEFDAVQKVKDLTIYHLKNVELVNSQKTIEQKNLDLINLNIEKDNILHMIAYCIKDYVQTTQSSFDHLLTRDPNMKDKKHAKMITEASNNAITLVNNLLYMNKINIDEKQQTLVKQDINETIDSLRECFRSMAKRKDIDLITDFHLEPLYCYIDKDSFIKVIDNLLINAINYTPTEGKISIKTKLVEKNAHLYITDNGVGMTPEQTKNIFNQFTETRHNKNEDKSSGIGLYIVKTILDRHNATISVKSKIGKGTEFVIKIPVII